MSTIFIATLLGVPVIMTSTYLLRHYPRQTAILAGEALLYAVPVSGYLALALILVRVTEPAWLQGLAVLSFAAVIIGLAPVCARRVARRLIAAEYAERSQEEGDRQA